MLASTLHLDKSARIGHDDVHVDRGADVLLVVEVQPWLSVDHADAYRRDQAPHGGRSDEPELDRGGEGVVDGDGGAGDRGGAGAAVRLKHVAVEANGHLTEPEVVEHRARTPADQALDLLGAPAELAALACGTRARRAREHRVLGREPSLARPFTPARDAALDARSTEHARLAERDQARAFGVLRDAALEVHGAEGIGRTARTDRRTSGGAGLVRCVGHGASR